MIRYDCEPNSQEWRMLRAGIPTASQFHRIVTKGGEKGPARSKQQEGYLFELLAERILGRPIDGPKTFPMIHGTETELEALAYYEMQTDNDTEYAGFITNDEGTYGASPDRLIRPLSRKRGLEIKCPGPAIHVGYLMQDGGAYDEYKVQAQGQMLVAELDAVDVVSYCKGLPCALHTTNRDEDFIKVMRKYLDEFCVMLAELEAKAIERRLLNKAEPRATVQQGVTDLMCDVMIETQRTA